jgi:hypothetical protein
VVEIGSKKSVLQTVKAVRRFFAGTISLSNHRQAFAAEPGTAAEPGRILRTACLDPWREGL